MRSEEWHLSQTADWDTAHKYRRERCGVLEDEMEGGNGVCGRSDNVRVLMKKLLL